ncbi:HU family DNA-binding protein [Francisella sp. TX07-6608]|uniref:HU family DNA-binding protein n=1 Tax=Francisella sp. TX07-6608 TaxID=573568 RepID=UPI0008F9C030|nr:HU family DNA-binding protein [Francisella sp. TX07-6608]OIN82979.1 bacterial DNA-binding family protein [Francisella sp. TX07-6608]OIN85075.1 bacterial DNA-binding family protein [Francisella sp. TX07-6608]
MTKNELIKEIAREADVTVDEARKCLDAFTKTITESLKKKQSVTLVGFGTFVSRKRAAREGRNPKTGEAIQIAATIVPSFKAGKSLKEAVAQSKVKKVAKKANDDKSINVKPKTTTTKKTK